VSLEEWASQQSGATEDKALLRVDEYLGELRGLGIDPGPFSARISSLEQEPAARRALVADSLLLDLAAAVKNGRESVVSLSMNLRNHLLATGRFLKVLSASVLRFNAKAWSLRALPIDLRVQHRCVAIITLRGRTLSPVVELFIDHARAVAKSLSPPPNRKN
jgi:hypothetical protein